VNAVTGSRPEEGEAYVCHARAPGAKSWIGQDSRMVPEMRVTPYAGVRGEDHSVQV
jgi:hypothetical protein